MKFFKPILGLLLIILCSNHKAFSQSNYQKPKLDHKDSWSLVMIPDIQNYVKWNRNQPILDLMMAWIEDHIDTLHVKMVVCTGDLVEHNDIINRGNDGDQSAQHQWEAAARAFSKLDGKVPYITAAGNHDYSIDREGHRTSRFNEFFKIDKNWMNQKVIVQNHYNEAGEPSLDNSAYELRSLNGRDYLFITTEFAPRDTVVTWAKKIADMEQYKHHRIVLLTHAYLNAKDERTTGEQKWFIYEPYVINNSYQKSARITLPYANNGQQLWEKLVQPAANIELVLCGHISGEGYRTDKNAVGKSVHQLLFDAQSVGGGHRDGNGGDGWLRILEFYPDNKTVKVKTFSPFFAASPTTQAFAWKKDARNEFTFEFDK
ncbi:metallophosphoesterase [Olivibacter ginsenosidimutans]|uniref:Metallophosphoesterase n=1 Tax=Olivibacter ginsenosidimutans TaxID=1176537 RepID=A0ABP9BRB9_9SPHI